MVSPRVLPPEAECDCHAGGPDLALSLHPGPGWNDLAFRSELRAVEQGHRLLEAEVIESEDGLIVKGQVVSNCRHSKRFDLTCHVRPGQTLPTSFMCNCESGIHRSLRYPVPCKHAAVMGRSLERRRALVWHEGLWWHPVALAERIARRERAEEQLNADPFEGLVEPDDGRPF